MFSASAPVWVLPWLTQWWIVTWLYKLKETLSKLLLVVVFITTERKIGHKTDELRLWHLADVAITGDSDKYEVWTVSIMSSIGSFNGPPNVRKVRDTMSGDPKIPGRLTILDKNRMLSKAKVWSMASHSLGLGAGYGYEALRWRWAEMEGVLTRKDSAFTACSKPEAAKEAAKT